MDIQIIYYHNGWEKGKNRASILDSYIAIGKHVITDKQIIEDLQGVKEFLENMLKANTAISNGEDKIRHGEYLIAVWEAKKNVAKKILETIQGE